MTHWVSGAPIAEARVFVVRNDGVVESIGQTDAQGELADVLWLGKVSIVVAHRDYEWMEYSEPNTGMTPGSSVSCRLRDPREVWVEVSDLSSDLRAAYSYSVLATCVHGSGNLAKVAKQLGWGGSAQTSLPAGGPSPLSLSFGGPWTFTVFASYNKSSRAPRMASRVVSDPKQGDVVSLHFSPPLQVLEIDVDFRITVSGRTEPKVNVSVMGPLAGAGAPHIQGLNRGFDIDIPPNKPYTHRVQGVIPGDYEWSVWLPEGGFRLGRFAVAPDQKVVELEAAPETKAVQLEVWLPGAGAGEATTLVVRIMFGQNLCCAREVPISSMIGGRAILNINLPAGDEFYATAGLGKSNYFAKPVKISTKDGAENIHVILNEWEKIYPVELQRASESKLPTLAWFKVESLSSGSVLETLASDRQTVYTFHLFPGRYRACLAWPGGDTGWQAFAVPQTTALRF